MKNKSKGRFALVSICMVLVFILTTASKTQDQDKIDSLCKNAGICEGYTYSKLRAISGGDVFVTDFRLLRLPKGATFKTSIPFCSIYEYDSDEDDDAGWQCLWKEEAGGYRFRLTSLNGRYDHGVTIKAVAFIIDTNVFKVNNDWIFSTSSSTSKTLSKSNPQNSITLMSVDTYETNGDDDFNFNVYSMGDSYHANTSRGNKGSYIHGRITNITLPSTMFSCQDNVQLRNNTVYWDSRLEGCGNLKYTKQFPLMVPSIRVYRFINDNVDKDFGIINNFFGMHPDGNKTWADLSTKIDHGNKDSEAWIQMTILGFR